MAVEYITDIVHQVASISTEQYIQLLINGITLGSMYGLIAIGYTMVYGIIGMVNFAHGEIFMIGAFCSLTAFMILNIIGIGSVPLAILIVLFVAMMFTATYGWAVERIAYRPLRHSGRLIALISAIGVSIFLQNYVQLLQGAYNKPLPQVIHGDLTILSSDTFNVSVSYSRVWVVVVTVLLMVIFTVLIKKTPLGRAQRACEQDKIMASLLGVNVNRVISLTFILGACLAAVAGMFVVILYGVINFYIGFLAGIKAFTAAVLGGIGSIPGAMIGGLLIGLIESFWSGVFSAAYKDVVVFVILLLVLIIKPSGLLGKPEIEKV